MSLYPGSIQQSPHFFKNPEEFRKWLNKHHSKRDVLFVGYYKKDTGKASITWPESVEVALCFGWIDGIRNKLNDQAYTVRFTPRRPGSNWSQVNIKTAQQLIKKGLMQPAGLRAFENRSQQNSKTTSYEKDAITLSQDFNQRLKKNEKAWHFFQQELAPGYRKTSIHWVMSAKKKETRERRFLILLESCESGKKIPPLRR